MTLSSKGLRLKIWGYPVSSTYAEVLLSSFHGLFSEYDPGEFSSGSNAVAISIAIFRG